MILRSVPTSHRRGLTCRVLLLLVLLVARLRDSELPRYLRAIPLSLAVAVGVSLLVNDSPLDVVAVGLVAYLAAQAYVSRDPGLSGFR